MATDLIVEAKETLRAAEEMYTAFADEGIDYNDRCWPPWGCIQYAQAAALIAIAERMDKLNELLNGIIDEGDSIRITKLR
jgi:hypothetical protein